MLLGLFTLKIRPLVGTFLTIPIPIGDCFGGVFWELAGIVTLKSAVFGPKPYLFMVR